MASSDYGAANPVCPDEACEASGRCIHGTCPEMASSDRITVPACPYCGMTAQVEPSRKHPGQWMCHGCADTFPMVRPSEAVSDGE